MTEIEFTPDAMAHGGDSVGRVDGKAVFVPGLVPGDRALIGIDLDKGSWARGTVAELLEPSPDRVEPPCPYVGECGGCQWQHIDYRSQLRWKEETVRSQLAHVGGLGHADVRRIIASPRSLRYRNRMDFHVVDGRAGLYRPRSRTLVPLDACLLLAPHLADLFESLGDLTGLSSLTVRGSEASGDRLIAVRGAVPDHAEAWEASVVRMRRGRPVVVKGRPFITEVVGEHSYRITANAFFQNNTDGAARLVDLVTEALDPGTDDVLVDGYAGGGLFGVALGDRVAEVIAVETSPLGLGDLEHNLEASGTFAAIVPAPFAEAAEEVGEVDLAVVDPPREGLGAGGALALVAMAPRSVAMVSCDPASLARDLRTLEGHGYRLEWVAPVDLFPQTYHVEAVARLVAV